MIESEEIASAAPETCVEVDTATWRSMAERRLRQLAIERPSLTSDDLWELMRQEVPGLMPADPRACGAVFLYGQKMEWIAKSNMTTSSTHRPCHGRDKRIWISLLHAASDG